MLLRVRLSRVRRIGLQPPFLDGEGLDAVAFHRLHRKHQVIDHQAGANLGQFAELVQQ